MYSYHSTFFTVSQAPSPCFLPNVFGMACRSFLFFSLPHNGKSTFLCCGGGSKPPPYGQSIVGDNISPFSGIHMGMEILFTLLLLVGIVFSLVRQGGEATMASLLSGGTEALELCMKMWGGYMFWMGILEVVRRCGLMDTLSRLLRPLLRPLFPHAGEALPAITMNLSANLLGMGSAATPFGLEAMASMEKHNPRPGHATHEMCALLILNAGCLELLPTGQMTLRQACSSVHPGSIWIPTLLSSACAMAVGIFLCLLLGRREEP